MAALRIAFAVALVASVTAVLIGPHLIGLWSRGEWRERMPLWWHRTVARVAREGRK